MTFNYNPDRHIITILHENGDLVITITPELIRDFTQFTKFDTSEHAAELAAIIKNENPLLSANDTNALISVLDELISLYGQKKNEL
jgi:hypothetical protein